MKLRDYDPLYDAGDAYRLWQESGCYPLTPSLFARYVSGRRAYRSGDAVVAERDGNIVGLGIIDAGRRGGAARHASIILVLVDLKERGQGLGSAIVRELEHWIQSEGVDTVHAGGWFWPGIPVEPAAPLEFFKSLRYEPGQEVFDLVIPLSGFQASSKTGDLLRSLGVEARFLSSTDLASAIEYQLREFPWWVDPLLDILPYDMEDVLLLLRGDEVIGCAMAFTPSSRTIVAGLQRQAELETPIGALGAVGIAESWRGKGLGIAMCEMAARHIEAAGATHIYVEEVEQHIVPFYLKMGGQVHGRCVLASKKL